MGLKRPFEAEEMQNCNAKHARQLTFSPKKLNHLDQSIPYHVSLDETGLLDDLSGLCEKKPKLTHDEKDFDMSAPLTSIGLCQEDAFSGGMTELFFSHQSSGSDFNWRPVSPVEDVYSCLMNQAPGKQVPIGSNHQADIPECVKEDRSETERKLMGKCIIPMPNSHLSETGQGRKECLCPDKDSIRCIRRHILEARENLIKTIEHSRFKELGFNEMGEEVTNLWTEEEEDHFHTVIYSNPVSMGGDFWKQLKVEFPSRTVKELVSYYFNVFILRRRGIQNRFKSLDVDSDDDDWKVEYEHDDDEDDEEEELPIKEGDCVNMANLEDDSCMSFELQDSNSIFLHRSGDDDSYQFEDRRGRSDCWNKNDDLLPTLNIIEEIFGQDDVRDGSKK